MNISRRGFLGYCVISAAALGLEPLDLFKLKSALAKPNAPRVIWLQGSGCAGCSISFLNRVAESAPGSSVGSLLSDDINLIYHPTLMAAAGEMAVNAARDVADSSKYILVVEGAVPTAFSGAAGWAWSLLGEDITLQRAITDLGRKASSIIAVGTCAAFGGVSASGDNPGGVIPVSQAITNPLSPIVNVPGCPPHPDWIVATIVNVILGKIGNTVTLDGFSRPTDIYGEIVHSNCPRRDLPHASTFGVDNQCLIKLGCVGMATKAPCPKTKWNGGANWCTESNAPCLGCTEPTFPDAGDFYNVPRR